MNKMHAIAKIVAAILGIYLLMISALALLQSLIITLSAGIGRQAAPFWAIFAVSMLAMAGFIVAVFYFLIYRTDIIARKIIKQDDFPEPTNPSAWYPFAMRLTVMMGGFFFLSKTLSTLSSTVNQIQFQYSLRSDGSMWRFYGYLIYLLIYLAISIYLLSGAPHFVRWQIKKTRELCKNFHTAC
jgi:hypothetical protein